MESVPVTPKKRISWFMVALLILLLAAVAILGFSYYQAERQLTLTNQKDDSREKIVFFDKLFVQKVLTTQGEVSAPDRLELEQAVANINDKDIQAAWNNFLESSTEQQAQQNVLVLLGLFADKLQ